MASALCIRATDSQSAVRGWSAGRAGRGESAGDPACRARSIACRARPEPAATYIRSGFGQNTGVDERVIVQWCPRAARRLAVRGAASRQSRARRPGAHSRSSASQGRHRGRSCDPRGSAAAAPEALVDDPPGSRPLRPRGAAQRSDRGRVARIRPRPAPAPATGVGRRSPALAVRGCARREVELGLIARIADPVSTSCRGRSSRADCGKASWHRGAGIGSTRSPMTGRCRVWKMTGGSESALGAAIKLATWRVGGGEAR